MAGMRPPRSTAAMRRAWSSPSKKTTEPGSRCSGQSVRTSIRNVPVSPLAPVTRATTRRSVVGDDLQLHVNAVAGPHHAQQAANRVRDPAVATDDPAHIRLVHGERQLHLAVAVGDLDMDAIGIVDQSARDVVEKLLHADAFAAAL